ncbi:MAG: MFS transporter [Gammaproteobacteria bacterium]
MPAAPQDGTGHPATMPPGLQAIPPRLRYRVIVASTIGNAFEWFDFTVFGLFTIIISRQFFPAESSTNSLLLGTATLGIAFFFRPIGGIVFGLYADRMGRKSAVANMVLLMALGSAMIAFVPGYHVIGISAPVLVVVARIIQGFSAGGEFGGATSLLIEYAPPQQRGFYGSFQMCSQALAITFAGFAAYALSIWLSASSLNAWGWRLPFLFGILVGPVGYYIRKRLRESPEFEAYRASHPDRTLAGFRNMFVSNSRSLVSGFGLTVAATISFYVTFIYMPIFADRELHLPLADASLSTIMSGILLVGLCPFTGYLSDRWNRKRMLVLAMALYALVAFGLTAYLLRAPSLAHFILLQFISALCIGFIWGPYPTAITEVFPVGVRSTSVSLIYNFSVMLFGGLAPLIITWLVKLTGNPMSPAYYIVCGVAISLLSYGLFSRDPRTHSAITP